MQEYLPALLPLTLGLGAFAVGLVFALRERNARRGKMRESKSNQTQPELNFGSAGNATLPRKRS